MPEPEIAYGVKQPGVYDGILYWVSTDGVAFHRFHGEYMRAKAQPFVDEHNAKMAEMLKGRAGER